MDRTIFATLAVIATQGALADADAWARLGLLAGELAVWLAG